MYVGRIVAIACNQSGQVAALYRVSSRSFTNRQATVLEDTVAILPKPGHEQDLYRNPYIAYTCLRLVGDLAVVANGTQTDYIAQKLAHGYSPRDALANVLLALDYEHDQLNTPRIAAIADRATGTGYLGTISHDALHVQHVALDPGRVYYVATYEHTVPSCQYSGAGYDCQTAAEACAYILRQGVFADLERPITAACAMAQATGDFEVAIEINGVGA
ncbi:hypothetical protein NKDENANG_03496 [Candidatus Entotheonellaceae bacterium PAL068K]